MIILSAVGISKSYSTDLIFEDVTFKVDEKDKVGVVGVNGAGKTTLFRLLNGEEEADAGSFSSVRDLTSAYMRQQADYTSEKTAYEDVLSVFAGLIETEKQLAEINASLEKEPSDMLIKRQHTLNDSFVSDGGLTFRSRTRSTLLGLGLTENEINIPMKALSGGQRTRVLLAKVLLEDAKLLILDEPTNHLDMNAVIWLENFLASYRGALIVVSHDRYFLDKVCNRIFELENHHLKTYDGNYTQFREKKRALRDALEKDYTVKSREIKRIEGIIEQQRRFNQERNYITIKSKQHQLDRLREDLVKPEKEPDEIRFRFSCCGECANEVLNVEGVSKSFSGKTLFKNADMNVRRGEKVFLTGENGCGKTTLFRIILSQCQSDSGKITFGPRVKVGYYDQTHGDLNEENTVFEELSDAYPLMTNTEIRCALGAFLFRGDDVFKKVALLSGGEKARVSLVKLMLSETNFLIMDEPTNHLDMESKEVLEKALEGYDGTLLMISHDRYFIDKLADRIYLMRECGIEKYDGNYSYFLEKSVKQTASAKKEVSDNPYLRKKAEEAEKRKKKSRLERAEKNIEELETKKAELEDALSDERNASDYGKLTEITEALSELNEKLEAAYSEWEQAGSDIEK